MLHLKTYLDQIKWERDYEGSFRSDDPLLVTQSKLRRIRDGAGDVLDTADVALLRRCIHHSLEKLRWYDYGPGFNPAQAERLRQMSIIPLLEADAELQGIAGSVT